MARDLVVGLCDPGTDPFWLQVKDAIYQKARRLPIQLVPISPGVLGDVQGPAAQLALVEELLALELHALVNWGWPEHLTLPVIDAGLPIVHLSETAVSHPLAVSPLGLYKAATLAAEQLAAHLQGRGHVLVVGGLCQPGLPDDGRSRLAAVDAVFARYPEIRYTHVRSMWNAPARTTVDAAVAALAEPPAGVLGLSDALALMALDALQARGMIDAGRPVAAQIPIVGINGDPQALSAITRGEMRGTVETDPYALGEQAIELAYLAAQHHPLPAHYPITCQLITAENVAGVAARRLLAAAALPDHLVDERDRLAQQRQLQLETSQAISRRISSLLDPEALVEEVTDIIRTHYGYERAFLYQWDPARRLLLPAGAPVAPPAGATGFLEPSGMLLQALQRDEAIFIPNTRRSLRFAEDPLWPHTHARIVLPIRQGGAVVGLLDLHCTRTSSHIGRGQLTELRALADQLGIAMQNARLYRQESELRAAIEKMEAVKTQFVASVSHELRSALLRLLADAPAAAAGAGWIEAGLADLLKVTGQLLDLSQVELGSPAPAPSLLDVSLLLAYCHAQLRGMGVHAPLTCPLSPMARLPLVYADPACLRRGLDILLDHLRHACAIAPAGAGTGASAPCLVIDADVELPFVHIGLHTGAAWQSPAQGAALSLVLAQRFFALLGGTLVEETGPDGAHTYHLRLPLPTLADLPAAVAAGRPDQVLAISSLGAAKVPGAATTGGSILVLQDLAEQADLLRQATPGVLLWDAAHAAAADWELLLAVRRQPQWQRLPFLLYAPAVAPVPDAQDPAAWVRGQSLAATIAGFCPTTASKSVLVIGGAELCRACTGAVARSLPGVPVHTAASAAEAGSLLAQLTPGLLIFDPQLPTARDCEQGWAQGWGVIDRLRLGGEVLHCPVLVLTDAPLDAALLARLARRSPVLYAGKAVFSPEELAALVARLFAAQETLPPRTSELVKQAIFFIQQHFTEPLNRADIAAAVAISENYLSQIFRQEMGISLWDYLNRHRIRHAQCLLQQPALSITDVAAAIGIYDPAYFSRIFHKQTGLSPSAYRVAVQHPSPGD
jgi:AraC-like DNA-binding protein/ABC-type sugar transport system substrate-binding protein